MSIVRVKICGLTRAEDVRAAVDAGADAIGLVFYDKSSRAVDISRAVELAAAAGPYVTVVGLFVNADAEYVHQVLAAVPLQVLQFHGDESADYCRQFQRPWYKAIRMHPELSVADAMEEFSGACGYLLDAWCDDQYGGTGRRFDWCRAPSSEQPIIVAGGLTPENVGEAVRQVSPYAVDVSGGVESAPGIKSKRKIIDFVANAKAGQ